MNTEIAKIETNKSIALASDGAFDSMFAQADKSDNKTPVIYAVQKMSAVVDDGIASPGDILENVNKQVIGGETEPLQIVVFGMVKTYLVYDFISGKKDQKSRRHDVFTKGATRGFYTDANLAEIKEEDLKNYDHYMMNRPCYNFFVLNAADTSGTPYIISCYGRGLTQAGRPIFSFLYRQYQQAKAAPYNFVFNLRTTKVESIKDKSQKWFVFKAEVAAQNGQPLVATDTIQAIAKDAAKVADYLAKSLNDSLKFTDENDTEETTSNTDTQF